MKNKLKLIDVSILSSYMGRWLTVAVAIAVFGITASALLSGGGSAQRNIINVSIPIGKSAAESRRVYEPLRVALGRETRRPVVLLASRGERPKDQDVYVMPMDDYLRHAASLGVVALYEIRSSGRSRDDAIIVARAGEENVEFSSLTARDIAFESPASVNGFWVQMSLLERGGFRPPRDAAAYRFEGPDASRIVFGVLHGRYRLGACRHSDLTTMTDRGAIHAGELGLVGRVEALPELVIAASVREADYYRRKFGRIGAMLAEPSSPATEDDVVKLLKSSGMKRLEPVTAGEIERAESLQRAIDGMFGTGETQ